ncbi:MAG: alpha/beta hydrolase fold domain-containing protein, partial [Desulfovibrio sp.]|nr:alpha/beta hydrolase fold domain-containing protein [Desulfovibrio sp.]
PAVHSRRVLLQLHGGGYQTGMQDIFRRMAALQAPSVGAGEAWMVHYRLAPQHVYPAALEDAESAWDVLCSRGLAASDIVLCADSAGANLALALCLELRRRGRSLPGFLALLSPWACMELDSPSRRNNARRDCVLGEGGPLHHVVSTPSPYAGGLDLSDPRLSPCYADLSGLPPMLIQAGGHEALLDDALALAAKAASDGVEVSLTVYPGMPHDFALLLPDLPESRAALEELRDFALRRHPA